uniref:BAALC binder of MAP3K1 and KLF4 n=1 Tax=Salvator merianae TaxID=96440 RepID=A0A8D0E6D1_SALMN
MGCGGSRADAIEPRYYESWTRETESTWLTNTDAADQSQQQPLLPAVATLEESGNAAAAAPVLRDSGILEDNKSTQTCITKSLTTSGIASTEKKTYCGTQGTQLAVNITAISDQRQQNGFRTPEDKWGSKKKAAKEVTINTTKTIRQTNSNRRVKKNCIN